MRTRSLIAVALVAITLWALPGAESKAQEKGSTEPQIGYAAQSQTQNTLVGCVSGSANNPLLVQPQDHRTYRLQGNVADLKNDLGKLVKVTGRLMPGTGPSVSGATESAPVFQVETTQNLGEGCHYAAGEPPLPATGKTGDQGQAMNATSTSSQGQVTPGSNTPAGRAQASGRQSNVDAGGVRQPQNQTATQGAPPVPEQTAQNPAAAEKIAQGAQRAELDNAQHELGVNAQPNYTENRNPQKHEGEEESAEPTHPTLVGCLTQGADESQFVLTEQKTGTHYRLNGPPQDLKGHVNHLVELVGRPAKTNGTAKAAAGAAEPAFEVRGVQDLAPTCGAERRR